MPRSDKIEPLKAAIAKERADASRRTADYVALLEKMKAFQQGTGPEPTWEEFIQWRDGVEHQVNERKLQSGFSDL